MSAQTHNFKFNSIKILNKMKIQITIFILFITILSLAHSLPMPEKFSQMEDHKLPLDSNQSGHGNCSKGWQNFENKVCFYGIKEQNEFLMGVEECRKLGKANFTSIHSFDEFKFIIKHWSLFEYWIGIVKRSPEFEDGTKVDPLVYHQFEKYVPWDAPLTPKGFICRAKPGDIVKESDVIVSNDSLDSNSNGKNRPSSTADEEISSK